MDEHSGDLISIPPIKLKRKFTYLDHFDIIMEMFLHCVINYVIKNSSMNADHECFSYFS